MFKKILFGTTLIYCGICSYFLKNPNININQKIQKYISDQYKYKYKFDNKYNSHINLNSKEGFIQLATFDNSYIDHNKNIIQKLIKSDFILDIEKSINEYQSTWEYNKIRLKNAFTTSIFVILCPPSLIAYDKDNTILNQMIDKKLENIFISNEKINNEIQSILKYLNDNNEITMRSGDIFLMQNYKI